MQEVQTNKSEKMVPIDTSGDAVDVEIKEEKVESVKTPESNADTPIVEVQEETTTPLHFFLGGGGTRRNHPFYPIKLLLAVVVVE